MHRNNRTTRYFILALLSAALLTACSTKPTSGQLMMDVTGESFPIYKTGSFSKNHAFWVFNIKDISRSSKQKSTIGVKGSALTSTTRALGFTLEDPAGYEWEIVYAVELQTGRRDGQSRKAKNIVSYTLKGRMEELNTMVNRGITATYTPSDPDFDGSLRGEVTNEKNEVLYTFESNPRLDVSDKPDDGLQVFSIAIDGTIVAVLDSRNGYEVTFFEGLLPTQRTQLAGTISSLFVLMEYGVL